MSPIISHAALSQEPEAPREIALQNIHTGEKLKVCFFDGTQFVEEALDQIDHICRDFRRDEKFPIDRRLLVQLDMVQQKLGSNKEIQIISGYRSPETNKMLRNNTSGVAKKSKHMLGKAIDFRIAGVDLKQVRNATKSLKAGGVGYYPDSGFIHIDTGRVRYW
jgi:uncharacterized protein YcbK (DUF882 family)